MSWLQTKSSALLKFIFYGNYFYGICAVALSIEATLQQHFPLNEWLFSFILFFSTVLYYTYPYVKKTATGNERTVWYNQHYPIMYRNQLLITVILVPAFFLLLHGHWKNVFSMPLLNWLLIFIFPAIAALYYGLESSSGSINLRRIGWLKPFIIGFTWAGIVNIYPVLFYDIIHELPYEVTIRGVLLFIKNLMFIALLCIMFDIKDYQADYLARLKTFVVNFGLRRTIFSILVPLALIGLGTFIYYAWTQHFSEMRVILNVIPFILLILAAWSLQKPRSILYYLIVIDGLMLIKAICGTIAISYF